LSNGYEAHRLGGGFFPLTGVAEGWTLFLRFAADATLCEVPWIAASQVFAFLRVFCF
jgi:hypothetical protein